MNLNLSFICISNGVYFSFYLFFSDVRSIIVKWEKQDKTEMLTMAEHLNNLSRAFIYIFYFLCCFALYICIQIYKIDCLIIRKYCCTSLVPLK